jgi:hypothetical protein
MSDLSYSLFVTYGNAGESEAANLARFIGARGKDCDARRQNRPARLKEKGLSGHIVPSFDATGAELSGQVICLTAQLRLHDAEVRFPLHSDAFDLSAIGDIRLDDGIRWLLRAHGSGESGRKLLWQLTDR